MNSQIRHSDAVFRCQGDLAHAKRTFSEEREVKLVELLGAVLDQFPRLSVVFLPTDHDTFVCQALEEGNPLVLSADRRINYNTEKRR